MSKRPQKKTANSQYYTKRMNTESFSSPSLKDEVSSLSRKIEQEITVVKRNLRVKNLKMFRAHSKLKTIEKEEEVMRETLRSQLADKMKQSQTNLEKMVLSRNSKSKSREELRQTTLSRIKSNEKSLVEESFRQSQRIRNDSERYLADRKMERSMTKVTSNSLNPSPNRTRYDSQRTNLFITDALEKQKESPQGRKIFPQVLKISDRELRAKQQKKQKLSQSKDIKNLHEYIQKLNFIDQKRQTRSNKLAETVKMIEKERKKELERFDNGRRKAQSMNERDSRSIRNYDSATKNAIQNKYSFSELYARKLEEKLQKKARMAEEHFNEGDSILAREGLAKKSRHEKKFMNETIKEVQRKVNFQFMEKLRK